jgi:hypothetical protein
LKVCFKHAQVGNVALLAAVFFFSATFVLAQAPAATAPAQPAPDESTSDDRILGLIPNYLAVEDPRQKVVPLTVKEKFGLFAKETFDPFTFASSAAGAALSQIDNDNPKYGHGGGPVTTQNFFQDAVLASLLHEDPRYFRRGPEFGAWYRVGYALSRVAITRTDRGTQRFNYSGVVGMGLGIGLSNAYYPDSSITGEEVATRFGTSLLASALGNLLPEFWPDFHEKFFHRKPRPSPPPPAPPGG